MSRKKKNERKLVLTNALIKSIFSRIANYYDLINDLLSFGVHRQWRRKMVVVLEKKLDKTLVSGSPQARVLDMATGTGALALELVRSRSIKEVIAVDLVAEMIQLGRKKYRKVEAADDANITWLVGDAHNFSLSQRGVGPVEAVTMVFGVRNFSNLPLALENIHRLLKVDGVLLILEFSFGEIKNPLIKYGVGFCLRWIFPLVGGVISGDFSAYRYLGDTVRSFPGGEKMVEILRKAGFVNIEIHPLTFGVVSLYVASKRN